ncbi:MAG: nucleotide exchange factor GrpE [Candidatus Peribacteraceae bacterium]|nr:nucleotide exchange factor GrpE [Candidatus Peribacteraceae bacterium]
MSSKKSENKPLKKTDKKSDEKIALLQEENDKLKELAARAQADLQNAKSRMEKEASASRIFAEENLLKGLLPTIDNFQRAFTHLPEDISSHDWVKGLQAVENAFLLELSSVGLKKMESLGQVVNPHIHDVLQEGEGEKGIITEVFEEGYLLHEKVLRPAKVMVGNGENEAM